MFDLLDMLKPRGGRENDQDGAPFEGAIPLFGEDPAGEDPAGEDPAGEDPAGEDPAGEDPAGEDPAGEDPAGEDPAGEDPAGEDPAGEDPAGEDPAGEDPAGEDPAGEDPAGEDPAGEDPAGEDPAADLAEALAASEDRAQVLAERLQDALVRLDGRLADPSDLPFNGGYLDGSDDLTEAISELLTRKPRLAARHVAGDIGAGRRGPAAASNFDLIAQLRAL